jgi:hypothetical protein
MAKQSVAEQVKSTAKSFSPKSPSRTRLGGAKPMGAIHLSPEVGQGGVVLSLQLFGRGQAGLQGRWLQGGQEGLGDGCARGHHPRVPARCLRYGHGRRFGRTPPIGHGNVVVVTSGHVP